MLEVGQQAPSLELPNQDGELVSLSDFNKGIVLYFYPKAGTEGCTTEAQNFRENWDDFEASGIQVIGVSTDTVDGIKSFHENYDLPFPLLSDEDGSVAKKYKTFGTPEIEGETYEIALRNTYVINPHGEIVATYEDVSPAGHAEEILSEHAL